MPVPDVAPPAELDATAVLARLGEPPPSAALLECWDSSVATLPEHVPEFLAADVFLRSREWAGLPATVNPVLEETARRVLADRDLKLLAWHTYRRVYVELESGHLSDWPVLDTRLGELAGVLYLLVALGMVPLIRRLHREMSIPESVTREGAAKIAENCAFVMRHNNGRVGEMPNHLYWYRHHVQGNLFRVGRFEYILGPMRRGIEVYRQRETGHVLALAEDGTRYNRLGYHDSADRETAEEQAWTAHHRCDDLRIVGFPISPRGHAVRQEIVLDRDEWDHVVIPGETEMLNIHIPNGGRMTPEACQDSFVRAVEFYQTHFPTRPFAGFCCASWIIAPQLEQIFAPTTNLVRLMRETYLFPLPGGRSTGLFFIFGSGWHDLSEVPRETTLQRRVAEHLEKGGDWRGGGMFLLTEDLPRYGTEAYRSAWPPAGVGEALG